MLTPSQLTIKSTGSATGNPRNKCALKPGHSLMDWIRLGNSGVDLTGFQGRVTPISNEELSKHNKREDAWLALYGKVYNVTRYMDFHPGGVEELMRGVGIDATKLFNEVHAWVNYQQLLAKCYIGPLKNVVKIDKDLLMALKTKTKTTNSILPPTPPPIEIVPRFDWIQKQSDLTFYFYTKQNCNPGLILNYKNPTQLIISIFITNIIHKFKFDLHADIQWPPNSIHVNSELGKIELVFSKSKAALWTTYGTYLITKVSTWSVENDFNDVPYTFEIISNEKFNHDSFEMCLKSSNEIIIPPIGYHFTMGSSINGHFLSRSYTPVGARFILKENTTDHCLRFLIKNYGGQGQLSSHLAQLPTGSVLQLSAPKGSFRLKFLEKRKRIILLAAGSGLTPCLNVVEYLLGCRISKFERLLFIYFNKTEADIWCRKEIEKIADADERINFVNVLSQPSSEWNSYKGHISKELLSDLFNENFNESNTFICICGPSGFNNLAELCLKELKYKNEDFHIFQG